MTAGASVAVVVCTYNGERFLLDQLRSIAAQSVAPAVIRVYDDGSSDATLEVAARFAVESRVPVEVRRNDVRLGYVQNFLEAALDQDTDYVAFSDQDDVWAPDKIERQLDAMARTGAAVSTHATSTFQDEPPEFPSRREETAVSLLVDARAAPWGNFRGFTLVFRRELLGVIPVDERGNDPHEPSRPLSHDRWLYFLGCAFGGIAVLPDVLAGYRQHPGQLYGREAARGLRARLRDKRSGGANQAGELSRIAAHRAALLRAASAAAPDSDHRWDDLAERYARSAEVYGGAPVARMRSWGRNVRRGIYSASSSGGDFGPSRLVEDLIMATLGPGRR